MIVSHEHKFIFLKTKKTAGTSIELALSALCGDADIITPLTEIDEALRAGARGAQNWRRHGWWGSPRPFFKRRFLKFTAEDYGFYNHMPAEQARALLNDDKLWLSYFKFAFDRNPWDRQVSFYHHRYRREAKPPPFSSFIKGDKRARINNYEIYSIGGEVAVDFVGRYENLDADLRHALGQVGLALDRDLPRAKTTFRKSDKPYRAYYDDETRGIVGDWYQREIALLDYAF
ncbi:sulfotransferase family 2 domain-containing protein [Methyloceanibacter sp.]|uniref:sulfotransferase family 2 domain-containing protein n=1 Tax=Methyloceanibacter sp. TaxID=1965321 RepID=UPI002D5AA812|nr:sulfotransferase family 2 domain-containing protein [Methyloceanibacter sp.]HZP09002.1 sulfotransferase family 2 domain-containing protein [Methyloceanibacter sp.]